LWWRVPDGEFGLSPDLLDAGRLASAGRSRRRRGTRTPLAVAADADGAVDRAHTGTDRACPHLPEGEGAKARSCRGTPAYPRARCAPVLPLPTLALRGDHRVLLLNTLFNQCLGEVGEEQLNAAGVAA
jgi:hypothetical protein